MPTIHDVARRAGVSISTVSNVLNGTKYVSDSLRKNVLQAVEETGYSANPFAAGMKRKRTLAIGVILSMLDSMFFPQVIRGIESVTEATEYSVQFYHTNFSPSREQEYIRELLRANVDGILLNSVAPAGARAYFEALGALDTGKKRVPVLSLERDLTAYGLDSICVDNAGGARQATEHLIERGCQRVIHIQGRKDFAPADERRAGYEQAMRAHGRTPRTYAGGFGLDSGYERARALLHAGAEFDGVCCANDMSAIGAIKACEEYSLRCPEQVKVIGFDNNFAAALVRPSLSTIHVPQRGMGERAATQLILRMRGELDAPAERIELPIRLLVRGSTDEAKRDEWELPFV